MKNPRDIPMWVWQLGMLSCAIIWGGSFVIIKGSLDVAPACWLMTVRFLIATVVMCIIFRKRLRENFDGSHLLSGALIGILYGAGFSVQNVGLTYTTPGRNAFLTATYCVLVPFANWAISRKRPGPTSVVAAFLCIVGIAFISLGDDLRPSLGLGEWLSLLSSVFFSIQIVFVDRFARAHDMITLSIVQLAFMSLTCWAFSLALGEQAPDLATLGPSFWASLAYLAILSSIVTTLIQNVGQTVVPPAQSALLLSLESVFAVIASVLFMGEQLTVQLVTGFALVFAGVLVSELGPMLLARRRALEQG
ncbi:MAG: DMT family transporter [Tractidigestivibacter sp.]|uniref:DMT family transporter n=1 Tax=Tractidigestivibacter sp. TaxID=2847320 RepID=UPI003D8B3B6B